MRILAIPLVFSTNVAHSEPNPAQPSTNVAQSGEFAPTQVDPVPPPRRARQAVVETAPSWDLDGLYLWLGPSGAASRIEATWDSTIGGNLAVVRIREREPLGAIGVSLGASRWTERGGGRMWLDAIAGTRLGRMVGVSAGPILELDDLAHPRWGGSVGLWAFLGVTPFVRVGAVDELGGFIEIGVHIALPVMRRRH